jgi:hypothetical protein
MPTARVKEVFCLMELLSMAYRVYPNRMVSLLRMVCLPSDKRQQGGHNLWLVSPSWRVGTVQRVNVIIHCFKPTAHYL